MYEDDDIQPTASSWHYAQFLRDGKVFEAPKYCHRKRDLTGWINLIKWMREETSIGDGMTLRITKWAATPERGTEKIVTFVI